MTTIWKKNNFSHCPKPKELLHNATQYTNYQVGKKIHRLKETFKSDNIGTEFGWDDGCGTVNATPEQWEHI